MILGTRTGIPVFFAVLLLLIGAAGCARPRSLSGLEEDALNPEQGFESVVFWRVKVLDRTGTINSRPRFFIERPGPSKQGEHTYDNPVHEPVPVSGEWTKQDGVSVFETMVFAAAKPDEYLFKDVSFSLYTDYLPNYYTGGSVEREVSFPVPLSRLCAIPPGKAVYLGEISIEFLKEERAGYVYRVQVVQESGDFNDAVKRFREAYPGLFKRFNRTVDTASWKIMFLDDFASNRYGWNIPEGDRHAVSEFTGGKYRIRSKNDECHRAGILPDFDRPQNFDIELVSTGGTNVDPQGYGLAFGSDRENAYDFLITGTGQAKIELSKNGEPQPALIPWTDASAGKAPGTWASRQKIEARGDTLRYYVDDRYVGEIKNELDGKDWFLGLVVCGKQTVEFDRLKLIER